jgi:hypothetical protein
MMKVECGHSIFSKHKILKYKKILLSHILVMLRLIDTVFNKTEILATVKDIQ